MEVIRQIAAHLAGQGLLSRDERSWLAREGFVSWYDVFSEEEQPAATVVSRDGDADRLGRREWVEQWEQGGFEGSGHRRAKRGKSAVPDNRRLTVNDLVATLRIAQESWATSLHGLVMLAAELGPRPTDWRDAVESLRQAEAPRIERAVIASLGARRIAFVTLWNAMACEPYADVVSPERAHGQVARGYEAVIHSLNQPHLGRHTALLGHREVAVVAALREAQRRVLAACEPLLGEARELLDCSMSRKTLAACYWTFVIAYSARRGGRANRPAPGVGESVAGRNLPHKKMWRHAWTGAAILDPRATGPFLIDYLEGAKPQPDGMPRFIRDRLICPANWNS